jgi:hypothetical protein
LPNLRGDGLKELALDLPEATYRINWINPTTGEPTPIDTFPHEGGQWLLFVPPYEHDIVLQLLAK